jgi:glycosyltransferase involved in cell wall biosynthesis
MLQRRCVLFFSTDEPMKILFLDQSGKLGGAELSLLDVAKPYRDRCLVGLFADGPFRMALEKADIPVTVLTSHLLKVSKTSDIWQGLSNLVQLLPLVNQVAQLSRDYDVIYANTQKAFVIGAIASVFSRRRLVYHLRDILSLEHFSQTNLRLAVGLANHTASLVIANSQATQQAFVQAGGRADLVKVIYNGFDPEVYTQTGRSTTTLRQQLGLEHKYVIGHFSRLSPWKGQHILIESLTYCPQQVAVLLVGDALFGEHAYVETLHHQVETLGLGDRVQFLGFRNDIPELMQLCDVVTHTSTAPEPFGRVIVEAMLCGTPVIAAKAGGAAELIEHGKTGWLLPPGDSLRLAEQINYCRSQPVETEVVARRAYLEAVQRFHVNRLVEEIDRVLEQLA